MLAAKRALQCRRSRVDVLRALTRIRGRGSAGELRCGLPRDPVLLYLGKRSSGQDKLHQVGNLMRQAVRLGSEEELVADLVIAVLVVLRLQQRAQLAGRGLKVDPRPAMRDLDGFGADTRIYEPLLDAVDALIAGGEEINNFIGREVLAVLGGLGVGTANEERPYSQPRVEQRYNFDLHLEQHGLGLFDVALLQRNTRRHAARVMCGIALDPAGIDEWALLVHLVVGGRNGENCWQQTARENGTDLHDEEHRM